MTDKPTQLEWRKCCDHSSCKREYPTNFGTFHYGTGFEPEEKAVLEALWNTRSGGATELLKECRHALRSADAYIKKLAGTRNQHRDDTIAAIDAHLEGEA